MGGKRGRTNGRSVIVGRARRLTILALVGSVLPAAGATVLVASASGEQASEPSAVSARQLDVSAGGDASGHTCALLTDANVRCWGFGSVGRLGYANTDTVGDDETPGSAGPVNLGLGQPAKAISVGAFHTCAILENGSVRCWGFGGEGRLGYSDTKTIGDDEAPGSAGPVNLGGQTARAISAGGGHTCAILADSTVRCWGFGSDGRLGYGTRSNIGDNETPGSMEPVDLGSERTAKAISAGQNYTCALLDNDSVRCWGRGADGRLGYGTTTTIGDDEAPASVGPVDLGSERTATAISAGGGHTCALLNGGNVRCWGFGGNGRLGYANTTTIGDDEPPGSVSPVNLGTDTAKAISVGDSHTCALLSAGGVRCWGFGADGRLGYASTSDVGDDEAPGSGDPLDLGPDGTATAISAGGRHTCARLEGGSLRCWGSGAGGRLGYCNQRNVGDDEDPASAGQVPLDVAFRAPSTAYPGCARLSADSPVPAPRLPTAQSPGRALSPLETEAARRRDYRTCLRKATDHARHELDRARRSSGRSRARLRRHAKRHRGRLRGACVKRHGRAPGRVTGLRARARSGSTVVLTFKAPGSDGRRPPPARAYLVKQSLRRPIRGARGFRRAQTLCKGSCRFKSVTRVGDRVTLVIEDLRPRTTYYYAVAARDNVSSRLGRRSRAVKARTR